MVDYLRSATSWAVFFVSLFVTGALTPLVIYLARRLGAVDSGGHRKISAGSVPLLGGIGIVIPVIAWCLVGRYGMPGMFADLRYIRDQFLVLAIGGLAIAALGVFDDVRGLRARYKLLAQLLIAVFVVSAGEILQTVQLPIVGPVEIGTPLGILLSVAWIVGLINAINLIDGVDGLAAGISLIAALGLLAMAAIGEFTFVVLLSVALAGSLIGFLPYNFHPARIFLGDTGSMFLGYMLATITLMGTYKSETAVIVVAPLLALGFPIFETLLSMTRRLVRGAPVFGADDRHTHHRLLGRGYSQRAVVLLLYTVSAILTAMAIMSRLLSDGSRWELLSPVVGVATLLGIGWLAGYLRPVRVEEMRQRRQRTSLLHAYARYAALTFSADPDAAKMEEVLKIGRLELGLDYLSVSSEVGDDSATSGTPSSTAKRELIRVKPAQAPEVTIEYEFREPPDDETRRDVAACLARVFEESRLQRIQRSAEGG